MQVGDLIKYTAPAGDIIETVYGIVVKELGYVEQFRAAGVSVYWFDSKVRTTEYKNDSSELYEVISASR